MIKLDDLKKNKTPHDEASIPLDKDYAHFPPVPTKQIIKHLTKKLKKTENPNSGNNRGAGTDVSSSFEAEANDACSTPARSFDDQPSRAAVWDRPLDGLCAAGV